jgi:hypothetical protein
MDSTEDFAVKDCALIALATGTRAQTLRGLHDNLLDCHPGSIYYHFWGGLLYSRFEQREYNNDFAAWATHALHDKILAERLGVLDPTAFGDIEDLRRELIDILEQRLDEREYPVWAHPDQQFEFLRSQIVVFDTGKRLVRPEELTALLPQFSAGSIFYHFIDARRRLSAGDDDFRGCKDDLASKAADLDSDNRLGGRIARHGKAQEADQEMRQR